MGRIGPRTKPIFRLLLGAVESKQGVESGQSRFRAFTQDWRIVNALRKGRMVVTVETVTIRWMAGLCPESSHGTRAGKVR